MSVCVCVHLNVCQSSLYCAPLSPSSMTWYWSKDGDVLRLGRWPGRKQWQPTAGWWLRATPGSALGPMLGNKYGKSLTSHHYNCWTLNIHKTWHAHSVTGCMKSWSEFINAQGHFKVKGNFAISEVDKCNISKVTEMILVKPGTMVGLHEYDIYLYIY